MDCRELFLARDSLPLLCPCAAALQRSDSLAERRAETRDRRVQPLSVEHREPRKLGVEHPKLHQRFAYYLHIFRSSRSFRFASFTVCHCMLLGRSVPPAHSGLMWSTTYPGHAPRALPVDGHGCCFT